MKTYTHPTITLPAGSVVVKFYDPAGTGAETMPDIITNIGDVEDGFDISLGELRVSTCEITMRNVSNYVATLLQSTALGVSVLVDNELYFLGDLEANGTEYDVLELSATSALGNIKLSFINRLAKLSKYKITDLGADIDVAYDTYIYMSVLFQYMAANIGLKSAAPADVNFITYRKFSDAIGFPTSWYLKDLVTEISFLQTGSVPNHYSARLDNAFQLLGELANDFFFYPSIFYDSADYVLILTERDSERVITTGEVLKSKPSNKYFVDRLRTFLSGTPDGFDMTDLEFISEQTIQGHGDEVELEMHHTNINRNLGLYYTNMILTVFNQSTLINYIKTGTTTFTSLHDAIHTAFKNKYFDNYKWRDITVHGLRGTYSSVARLHFLMPTYNFTFYGENHFIHTVKKSVMNNQSELLCLVTS